MAPEALVPVRKNLKHAGKFIRIRVGLLSACAAGLVAAALFEWNPVLFLGYGMVVLCFGLAGWLGLRQSRRHLFSPPVLVFLYMGLGIGVKGILNQVTLAHKLTGVLDPTSTTSDDLLVRSFGLGILSVLCFLVGDRWAASRKSGLAFRLPSGGLRDFRLGVVLTLGTALTLFGSLVLLSRLGWDVLLRPSFISFRGTFGLFWLYPLLFAGIYAWSFAILSDWASGKKARPFHVLGLILITLLVYLLTSSKNSVVTAVVLVMVSRHFTHGPIRIRTLLGVTASFLMVLPVLYFHRAYGLDPRNLAELDPALLLTGATLFLGRSYLADSLAAVLHYTPSVYPFLYGRPWLEPFYFWIPRALWPEKPLSAGLIFGESYLSSYSQSGQSFFTITMVGDGYMNFGVPGVIVLMLGLGYGLRRFYDALVGPAPEVRGILVYGAAAYPIAISAEQTLGSFLSLALSYLTLAGLIAIAGTGVSRRQSGLRGEGKG